MVTVMPDIRGLVHKLCEQRGLPLLVTDLIAGCLDYRDLLKINILSRALNVHANEIIYRDIAIDLYGAERSDERAALLLRSLLTRGTAANAVRTLSLAGDPLLHWRNTLSPVGGHESVEAPLRGKTPPDILANLSDFTQEEIGLYDNVATFSSASRTLPQAQVSIWTLCLHILRLTPSIQDSNISSDYFRVPEVRDTLQKMAREGFFQKLQRCNLCLDLLYGERRHASVVEDWDNALLFPFMAPAIKSVAAVMSLRPDAVRHLRPGGSSVTRLVLYHYQIGDSDMIALLAATPGLQYLEYHAVTDYAWLTSSRRQAISEHAVGLDPLYDGLCHVAHSLKELHTSHDIQEDSIHFQRGYAAGHEPPFRLRKELSSLAQLHTLTIPYATLLGWTRKDYDWDWNEILPSSLRHIILNDNLSDNCLVDGWKDESLMPVITKLLEWLSALHGEDETAEFGLHLFQLDSDFNEPVQQELSRTCQGLGVPCSIQKIHPDRNRPAPRPQLAGGRGTGNVGRGRGRGRGV
ncbi:hypothetical protein EJ05DRAFT_487947 [Pseudovirgaria hyperparasitica]|uniref:F-box domain-containing protein n=1 Tax=Pseudovirgaria hyperparasitica TaxID=470096 RepID=A0A6A6VZQ1_9PEZI|nr:uncharacterized protein EJ05DRAFT_487947 [Pseudovirgaria hyperparasitica]KAF2756148.1 hypothetical protein EJ05DRAFT_487947 [Pseudovirgaria hyperparasitica]